MQAVGHDRHRHVVDDGPGALRRLGAGRDGERAGRADTQIDRHAGRVGDGLAHDRHDGEPALMRLHRQRGLAGGQPVVQVQAAGTGAGAERARQTSRPVGAGHGLEDGEPVRLALIRLTLRHVAVDDHDVPRRAQSGHLSVRADTVRVHVIFRHRVVAPLAERPLVLRDREQDAGHTVLVHAHNRLVKPGLGVRGLHVGQGDGLFAGLFDPGLLGLLFGPVLGLLDLPVTPDRRGVPAEQLLGGRIVHDLPHLRARIAILLELMGDAAAGHADNLLRIPPLPAGGGRDLHVVRLEPPVGGEPVPFGRHGTVLRRARRGHDATDDGLDERVVLDEPAAGDMHDIRIVVGARRPQLAGDGHHGERGIRIGVIHPVQELLEPRLGAAAGVARGRMVGEFDQGDTPAERLVVQTADELVGRGDDGRVRLVLVRVLADTPISDRLAAQRAFQRRIRQLEGGRVGADGDTVMGERAASIARLHRTLRPQERGDGDVARLPLAYRLQKFSQQQ